MFTVAMHNISTGFFFLGKHGELTRINPLYIATHHQACTVAKAQAEKHKCIYCVHDKYNRVTKTFRPTVTSLEAVTREKEKEKQKVKRMKGE